MTIGIISHKFRSVRLQGLMATTEFDNLTLGSWDFDEHGRLKNDQCYNC